MKKTPILIITILATLSLGLAIARAAENPSSDAADCKTLSDSDVKTTDCEGADCGQNLDKKDVGAQTINSGSGGKKKK